MNLPVFCWSSPRKRGGERERERGRERERERGGESGRVLYALVFLEL